MAISRIALIILLFSIACGTPKQVAIPKSDPVDNLAQSTLGPGATPAKNKNGSFVLYTKEGKNPDNDLPSMKFLIIRMYDQKIVEQGSVTMGSVAWSADYEVEIAPAEGQPQLLRSQNAISRKIDLRKYLTGIPVK